MEDDKLRKEMSEELDWQYAREQLAIIVKLPLKYLFKHQPKETKDETPKTTPEAN
jgi:hypothetical protein